MSKKKVSACPICGVQKHARYDQDTNGTLTRTWNGVTETWCLGHTPVSGAKFLAKIFMDSNPYAIRRTTLVPQAFYDAFAEGELEV